MPFDGVVARCAAYELNNMLAGSRIEKIYQPESDEIIMNIRTQGSSFKLLLSASPSYPRIHVTKASRENPKEPPMFCMLLRKHLAGGKIISIDSPDYERILNINTESLNELGDSCRRKLVIEIMGRHSNIILLNSDNKIIDAARHIDSDISSVREVMPARQYALPPSQNKTSISGFETRAFTHALSTAAITSPDIAAEKYLLSSIKGFSPLLCREICFRARIPASLPIGMFHEGMAAGLADRIMALAVELSGDVYHPCLIGSGIPGKAPLDFHCINITSLGIAEPVATVNEAVDLYFTERDRLNRLKQKKSDIIRIVSGNLERSMKKKAIHEEKLSETAGRDKLRLYGELLTAYAHAIPDNTARVSLPDYHDENGGTVDIDLDPSLSPNKNAQKYFKAYSKAKSAFVHAQKQLTATLEDIEYLESVLRNIEECDTPDGISEIRSELSEAGYTVSSRQERALAKSLPSLPAHYLIGDNSGTGRMYDVFAGRNNTQNDKLTLKQASPSDIWLHTKKIPGSHVIIRTAGMPPPPESVITAAARIAAWNSRARMSSNVPVDYTPVKNVKKPPGAKPGMVIYDKYKTIIVTPDESFMKDLKEGVQACSPPK